MSDTRNDDWDFEETEPAEKDEQDLITYEISYYPADFTLKGYLQKFDADQIYVPDFQRSYVWDQVKASKLVESFLLGLPVPGVFLYKERSTNLLQIIDGQQRIMSAIRFFKNEFNEKSFRLKNVNPKWEGKRYEDLDERDQLVLDDSVLRATVVQQLDPEDDTSIYHIFERLNTGGVNLNPMEIRKCVYYGPYFSQLEELNQEEPWRKLIGRQGIDKRLRDVELVLRVLALSSAANTYEKPMKQFLNAHMLTVDRQRSKQLEEFLSQEAEGFILACTKVVSALGEKPFHLRNRLNYAVLDSVLGTVIQNNSIEESRITTGFQGLLACEDFIESVSRSTSDEAVLKKRFALANDYLVG